jgi:signal transduction histidine kinase
LRPGTFRFHVIASNNNGVWNRAGATLTIEIPPTFFQTWLFRACCLIAGIVLLWAIYSLRVRRVAGRMRKLLEERVSERERIARELHDTLLQGVQGLVMRFQSVADHIADTHPAKSVIDCALDRADQVLIEGRDRVRDLRAADSRSLDTILEEVAREQPFAAGTSVTVVAEGAPRDLQPLILDEIVRIAGEALFNAALHAEAQHVQVRILYSRKSLKVVFADDGKGIGAERLLRAGREGHFGVIGMHERARRIGAQLSLDSAPGQGTKIKVRVNASVAFVPLEKRWFVRRWSGRHLADT